MKIYLRKPENFHSEALEFYKNNFELTEEKDADVIVINNFEPITTDRIVACNSTGIEHIKTLSAIISLRGEDLSDLTAVPEICLGTAILLFREKQEEVRGKTLGLIGYGRIAKKFKEYAESVGMEVYACDKGQDINLIKVLNCDIVSLHITSDEENRNFIKKGHFEKMKDRSIFMNSARPWLVEEEGFKWALDNKLSMAWVDFDLEFSHRNLMTSSHLGGSTKESKQKSEMIIAKKLWELSKSS